MTKLIHALACASILVSPTAVAAQSAPPLTVGQSSDAALLRAGTSVPLRTLAELTTEGKRLRVGHRFNLEVAEPVSVNGVVVIPVGSPAVGEVTHVRNKGMWGRSGAIEARLVSVSVNGRTIRLTGAIDDKGTTGTAGVVGAVVALPIAGFFVTGTSARIPAGSSVIAFTEEDLPVVLSVQSNPMVAPAVAQPIVTQPAAQPVLTPVAVATQPTP